MANYARVTPATLTNYSAVINDPTDDEARNKAAQIDLQTRRFVYDFLDSKFDKAASDVLKAGAVADATVAGKVKGSTSNAGTQQGIVQGTVSTPDLRDGAVTTAKLATGTIATANIADGQITTAKIADAPSGVTTAKISDLAVTTAKIAADAVTATELKDDATGAAGAVTTDHIRSNAVTTAKINAAAVTGAKMVQGSSGQIFVCNSSGEPALVTMSGAATISNTGVVTLATTGFAVVEETAGNTVAGGASLAGGAGFTNYSTRGVAIPWVKTFETLAMVTLPGSGKIALTAGTYIVEGQAPSYLTDENLMRISRYNSSNVLQESVYGTSNKAAAADTTNSQSNIYAKFVMASGDYLLMEHWHKTAQATNGLGFPSSSGGAAEKYAIIKLQKIA